MMAMIRITNKQFDQLSTEYRSDYLLQVVSEWYAIYQQAYETPAQIPFAEAWEIGNYLLDRLEYVEQEWEREVSYELIHEVLLASEQGYSLDRLPEAVDQFCKALPASEAAFALLNLELKL
jgi:hypothetical protein